MTMPTFPPDIPGHEFCNKGMRDLASGILSDEGLLLLIGRSRLKLCGVELPNIALPERAEILLYRSLQTRLEDGAHAAYNALVRKLVSAERTLQSRVRNSAGTADTRQFL